jgi:hypothetical protein
MLVHFKTLVCLTLMSSLPPARSPSPPSLELMVATQPPVPGLGGPTLVCLAKGFHPAGAALSWSEDGASVRGEEVRGGVAQRQPDGSYSLSSALLLPSTRWRSGHTFTCHVSHSALSSPLSKSVSSQQCSLWQRTRRYRERYRRTTWGEIE